MEMCLYYSMTVHELLPFRWLSIACCSSHEVASSQSWDPTFSLCSWRISYSTLIVGETLHRVCPPSDAVELVFQTQHTSWLGSRANSIVFAGFRPIMRWRFQTCYIAVAASVRILSYDSWGRAISIERRVSIVTTPSARTVPSFFDSFLFDGFFVRLCLSATPVGEVLITGPNEFCDVLFPLTPRRPLVTVKTNAAELRRVHRCCVVQD